MYTGVSLDQAPPEDIPLRFFLSAPIFGIIAGFMLMAIGEDLFISNWSTDTIALTHLFTLGWLAMIMMGAFYQMVPVLVGGSVPYIHASRYVHALFTLGVMLVTSGIYLQSEIIIIAAAHFLIPSTLFFIVQIAIALFRVEGDRPTVIAMRISIAALLATVVLGIYFLGGHALLWDLPDNRAGMTGVHLVFGLFGWVGGLIMGVGFHVIPMFYMTPEFPKKVASLILWLFGVSLLFLPMALVYEADPLIRVALAFPGFLSFSLFVYEIFRLIGKRRRKITDATLKAWKNGMIFLPLSMLALIYSQFSDHDLSLILFGILFIFGFGLTITTGMLYKIVPFLVWFHRFSLLIGKVVVPHLKDISPDKRAVSQLGVFVASLFVICTGVIVQSHFFVRFGGLLFSISSLFLLVNLIAMVRMKAPEVPLS